MTLIAGTWQVPCPPKTPHHAPHDAPRHVVPHAPNPWAIHEIHLCEHAGTAHACFKTIWYIPPPMPPAAFMVPMLDRVYWNGTLTSVYYPQDFVPVHHDVPEPASAWILLGALILGGIAWGRKRS